MKVVVLGGGDSPEREVSLRSAKAVYVAAKKAGFDTLLLDPINGLGSLKNYREAVVLPILHGKNGEDGWIQSRLENLDLPYLGTKSAESSDCFDKWTTREILTEAGLPMAKAEKVNKANYEDSPIAKGHHVLKVLHGGSSIGTLIARRGEADHKAVAKIFAMEPEAVLEELIEGIEITVPILGSKALPVIEIQPPEDAEFDYDNKYNGKTQELCPPKNVSRSLQQKAQRIAEKAHKVMGARHLSRVDMMIDKDGQIYVLEINTMPGLTDQSLFPKAALVAGITMPELVTRFVRMVQNDT